MPIDLRKLSICIFTRGRKFELERIIKFWLATDVTLIILDASTQSEKISRSDNLKYLHVPNLALHERLLKFTDLIETEYVLLSPDDDFFSPLGLLQTINFLDKNIDFASAQGLRVRFFDFPFFHWIPDYVQQSNLKFIEDDKIQRLEKMAPSMHYIYSVMRVHDFIKTVNCLKNVDEVERNGESINELVFNYVLPILGKHIVLPFFYSARKNHVYKSSDVLFSNWINDQTNLNANTFKKNIETLYVREIGCSQSTAEAIVLNLTENFTFKKVVVTRNQHELKRLVRNLFYHSKFRIFHPISRLSFFWYYALLMRNSTFFEFFRELHLIRKFLTFNRILGDS